MSAVLSKATKAVNTTQGLVDYYLSRPSIIEICGSKGSGKTCFALYLAGKYNHLNPGRKLYILNCTAGITLKRLDNLVKTVERN